MGAISIQDAFKSLASTETQDEIMPIMFVGHGSPMNAIEANEYTNTWKKIGQEIPKPKAILCVSAHWLTTGTWVTAMDKPKTIHDFGGFPKELFAAQYPAPGSPEFAKETAELITKTKVGLDDHEWGLDHGTWSVLMPMFPKADIPVFQLSIDYAKPASYHYELAQELQKLRRKGVLILGSGNIVHNLGLIDWKGGSYDWAIEFDNTAKTLIDKGDHQSLINYEKLGKAAQLSIPTPDHYYPMLYTLGLQNKNEQVHYFNDKTTMGSISMRSFIIK